jgi:hypothetical protein
MEERIERIENQLKALQAAFLQSQRNQIPVTAKTDDTANKVTEITPWTASKTAYIEDTECIFNDVPSGNMSVFCPVNYTVERMDTRVTVKFEPLEEVTEITISII